MKPRTRPQERRPPILDRRHALAALGVSLGAGALAGCTEPSSAQVVQPLVTGGNIVVVETLAELNDLAGGGPGDQAPAIAIVQGYADAGDGGGGVFQWVAATLTEDGGTKMQADGGGTWVRQYVGALDVRWFGVKANLDPDDPNANITENALALARAVAAANAVSDGAGPPRPASFAAKQHGATLYFPPGRYVTNAQINVDETYGLRFEGGAGLLGLSSTASASILFTQDGDENAVLLSARGAVNFQLHRLDIQYSSANFFGHLVSNAFLAGGNPAYAVFENCNFSGTPTAYGAASLLNMHACLDMIVRGCTFRFAQVGILGTDAYVVSVEDSTFLYLQRTSIHNPADQWLIKSCGFEGTYLPPPEEDCAISIHTEPGRGGRVTVLSSWFGDGSGGRPWIQFGGFMLTVQGCSLHGQDFTTPLIRIVGNPTVGNVNIQSNVFLLSVDAENNQPPRSYAIEIGTTTNLAHMFVAGNYLGDAAGLVANAERIVSRSVIETLASSAQGIVASAQFSQGIRTFANPVPDGLPQDVPHASTVVVTPGWTVPALNATPLRYTLCGKLMTLQIYASETTIASPVDYLELELPANKKGPNAIAVGHIEYTADGATWATGTVSGAYQTIRLYRADRSQWPAGPMTLSGVASLFVEDR